MHKVDIWIAATPSKYWAKLEFTDRKNRVHRKQIKAERKATLNSNILQAAIEAVKALNYSCLLDIHTDSDYLISAFRNGWINAWKENGWKTAKNKEIRNKEQWERLAGLMAAHSARFYKTEGENNGFYTGKN